MENINQILETIKTMEQFPLEVIFARHLRFLGIRNSAELTELLDFELADLSFETKDKLYDAFCNLESGKYVTADIPLIILKKKK